MNWAGPPLSAFLLAFWSFELSQEYLIQVCLRTLRLLAWSFILFYIPLTNKCWRLIDHIIRLIIGTAAVLGTIFCIKLWAKIPDKKHLKEGRGAFWLLVWKDSVCLGREEMAAGVWDGWLCWDRWMLVLPVFRLDLPPPLSQSRNCPIDMSKCLFPRWVYILSSWQSVLNITLPLGILHLWKQLLSCTTSKRKEKHILCPV